PPAYDLPQGPGLHASHVLLPDGRPVAVYHDRGRADLVLQVLQGSWERHELDADEATDTGMWADALVAGDGTVHVAYKDSLGDRLLYTTWRDGAAGAVELIDDGVRAGETRPHPVGASASLFIDAAGDVAVAYQDGFTSDVSIARRTDGAWTRDDLLVGPLLDGFHVSAATGEGRSVLGSYQYDQSEARPGVLEILVNP